ncbi:MAG: hypothetical protein PVF58_08875 [Candidatus Methanofastidiosia archaeon]
MKDLVVFIDSIEGIKHKDKVEISIKKFDYYTTFSRTYGEI